MINLKTFEYDPTDREQVHDLVVEMWNEMIEYGLSDKEHSQIAYHLEPKFKCFACEYYNSEGTTYKLFKDFICDTRCPFFNIKNDRILTNPCETPGSKYYKYTEYKALTKQDKIAIADLFIGELKED